ncbi:MAG: NAAT family transporter [Proteobacteria bacterium]|nr:NAAT family transporter [Pseudomonadota bacterium]
MLDELVRFFVVLFVVVDPPSMAPIFATMTEGGSPGYRRRMALKSSAIALAIFVAFALGGGWFIGVMGITIEAFRIGGGLMLFLIALDMVFAREEKTTPEEKAETRRRADISVFPLAFPLISGPGAIATVLLTFGSARADALLYAGLIAVIAAVVALALAAMLAAPLVMRVLGVTGANVVSRVAGVVLAALAVQFVIDGLKGAFRLG